MMGINLNFAQIFWNKMKNGYFQVQAAAELNVLLIYTFFFSDDHNL